MAYIVTDLTRLKGSDEVCIAVLGCEDGLCRRPLPYKNRNDVEEFNIRPGALIQADSVPRTELSGPHTEDCDFHDEKWPGLAGESDFMQLLGKTAYDSLSEGFCGRVNSQIRCVAPENCPDRSIVTLRVIPEEVKLSIVDAGEKKMRLTMTDSSGERYRRLPVADLHFYSLAMKLEEQGRLEELGRRMSESSEVFMRVGLGRLHESGSGKKGYWVQVNGIYCFPGYYDLMGFE